MATLFRFVLFCFLLILASSAIGHDSAGSYKTIKRVDFDCLVQEIDRILKDARSGIIILDLNNIASDYCDHPNTKHTNSSVPDFNITHDPESNKSYKPSKFEELTYIELECIKKRHEDFIKDMESSDTIPLKFDSICLNIHNQ